MINYPRTTNFQGAIYVGNWGTSNIPIFNVPNMHALNQLVGYIKHINAGNGTVLYRGQCQLYEKVSPSIKHEPEHIIDNEVNFTSALDNISQNADCLKFFGLNSPDIKGWELYKHLVIEAVLQHYGAKTYSVDFVDNHWTALWFGLYMWDKVNNKYILREPSTKTEDWKYIDKNKSSFFDRTLPPKPTIEDISIFPETQQKIQEISASGNISILDLEMRYKETLIKRAFNEWKNKIQKKEKDNEKIDKIENSEYLYIFLYVADTNISDIHGLYIGENTYTIDLRKILPSIFLRPSSQHGWIVKGKNQDYDFNSQIPCVIQINIKLAKEMLGNGTLLSQENFFPNKTIDQGYRVLLESQVGSDKHPKLIPDGMIANFND